MNPIRKVRLVYQLPPSWTAKENDLPAFKWVTADNKNVVTLFADNRGRKNEFLKFLRKKFIGIVLYESSSWASYAWMSRPSRFGPPHLPGWIQGLEVFWIFCCRTREEFRGRGLYKLALKLIIEQAFREQRDASVLIDVLPDNIPSRHGIISAGFVPKGVITSYKLGIPNLKWWAWGRWDTDCAHPELPGIRRGI